jgi:hypothetical protein
LNDELALGLILVSILPSELFQECAYGFDDFSRVGGNAGVPVETNFYFLNKFVG